MRTSTRLGLAVCTALACASLAPAQSITVPPQIALGQIVTVHVNDPDNAGANVLVTIEDQDGQLQTKWVTLDECGHGTCEWLVATSCNQVTFKYEGHSTTSAVVQP